MNHLDSIVQMSYAFFSLQSVTPESLKAFIVRMKVAFPEDNLDEEDLFRRLESIHSVSIQGSILTLEEAEGHEEWFNVSTNCPVSRDFSWHYWDHLKNYLTTHKRRSKEVINSLDQISSEILSRIEDPYRFGSWDRRGMVMGSVQSGKTANFTALICKAMDAGYKFVVVLAGIHNSLRSQTQDRLNEELLGYDLDRVQQLTGEERRIGVGSMFGLNHKTVNTLTSSSGNGDFSRSVALQAGIIPSATGDPIILVIKKNVTILKNLYTWLSSLPLVIKDHGKKTLSDIPMLLIDDECDFASVNTKMPEYDGEGNIVEDWNPTKTNELIRKILFLFQKSAYVGYTATPYANIFIHKDDYHPKLGDDLFPRHFIISLPQPSNYIGPDRLFGMDEDQEHGIEGVTPLPLLRPVSDYTASIPDTHKKDLQVNCLPDSLKESLKAFLLVCAVRRIRKRGVPHNSMLIHVTRFNAVQKKVKDLVEAELRSLLARIQCGTDSLLDFRKLWELDFDKTTHDMASIGFDEALRIGWDDVQPQLYEATRRIKVKGINGEIGDILDYRDYEAKIREFVRKGETVPWEDQGISVIAIGGDKLSRGLTLEGLCVSYYLRASRMYDTLMQMGRWFGYRDGYNDLCRIYTTQELIDWYKFIALANQELRNQLEYMAAINSVPEKFGLKVRNYPGRLTVTAAGKSRHAENISISFSGEFPKTIVFDPRYSKQNLTALETLVRDIGRDCKKPINKAKPRYQWEKVEPMLIINFLRNYRTQEIAQRVVDPARIADFIERQEARGELIDWHVVIVSTPLSEASNVFKIKDYEIGCNTRSPHDVSPDKISIGTLTSPADEFLDFTSDEINQALEKDIEWNKKRADGLPTSLAVRHVRPKTRGLLLIYFPCCDETPQKTYGLAGNEVVGFAISFPVSDTAVPIEYLVVPEHQEEW